MPCERNERNERKNLLQSSDKSQHILVASAALPFAVLCCSVCCVTQKSNDGSSRNIRFACIYEVYEHSINICDYEHNNGTGERALDVLRKARRRRSKT